MGAGPSDYLHPLSRGGYEEPVASQLTEHLKDAKGYDLLDLHQIRETQPLARLAPGVAIAGQGDDQPLADAGLGHRHPLEPVTLDDRRHDGRIAPRQKIKQRGFSGIGRADDGNARPLAQSLAATIFAPCACASRANQLPTLPKPCTANRMPPSVLPSTASASRIATRQPRPVAASRPYEPWSSMGLPVTTPGENPW